MKDQERARRLARAVDDLIEGRPHEELDDRELEELLQIAKIRLDAARSAARLGAQHEGAVWQRVLASLRGKEASDLSGFAALGDPVQLAATGGSEEIEIEEMQGIIYLRRQAAQQAARLAESHRAIVWQRVQARIRPSWQKAGLVPFLRRHQSKAASLSPAVNRLAAAQLNWQSRDSRLEELVRRAQARRGADRAAAVRGLRGRLWPRLATAAAAVALLLAALGPIPATGLANHPVAQIVRFVGDHVGVSETGAPPLVPPNADTVQGIDVTAAQAGELLGLPLWEPTIVPGGFRQVFSRYFPQPLTASEGGMFVLAYAADVGEGMAALPTVLIYQERASGADIAVLQGSALDLILSDGTPATYVEGSWQTSGSQIVWGGDGARSLIFDRAGLRTTIYSIDGAPLDIDGLRTIAEGMTAGAAP